MNRTRLNNRLLNNFDVIKALTVKTSLLRK